MKSDSQKIEEIRELVKREESHDGYSKAGAYSGIKKLLNESPSNQECESVAICGCSCHYVDGQRIRRFKDERGGIDDECGVCCENLKPYEEERGQKLKEEVFPKKKCSCTKDFCDPKCPIHEGYWINKGQVSPAAPHPKKNNTKECSEYGCWRMNPGNCPKHAPKKEKCYSCGKKDCRCCILRGELFKKEERCTCKGYLNSKGCSPDKCAASGYHPSSQTCSDCEPDGGFYQDPLCPVHGEPNYTHVPGVAKGVGEPKCPPHDYQKGLCKNCGESEREIIVREPNITKKNGIYFANREPKLPSEVIEEKADLLKSNNKFISDENAGLSAIKEYLDEQHGK